jgi:hypothetical protein
MMVTTQAEAGAAAMSNHEPHEPRLVDRIRRWLWLDGTGRTDASEANRGFYPGLTRKPVSWRFVVLVGSLGILIGLIIVGLDLRP